MRKTGIYEETLSLNGADNSHTISLPSALGQGVYFIKINTEQGVVAKKIIVQ